jgi:K+ transporter
MVTRSRTRAVGSVVDYVDRLHVRHPDDGIVQVIARFGYMVRADVPASLRLAAARRASRWT